MSFLFSLLYTILVGGAFIYLFIFTYDFFYGEKRDKQMKKIQKHFRKETVIKLDLLEHQPKKFTMYQVKTNTETKKVKVKPGYKIVKMVKKKK